MIHVFHLYVVLEIETVKLLLLIHVKNVVIHIPVKVEIVIWIHNLNLKNLIQAHTLIVKMDNVTDYVQEMIVILLYTQNLFPLIHR